jgi:hypothetical protein
MSRQKLILSILLIALALSIGYAFWKSPRQRSVAQLKYAPGAAAGKATVKSAGSAGGKRVRLDLLEGAAAAFGGFRRNIFRPIFLGEAELAAKASKPAAAKPQKAAPPPVPYVPPKDIARLTFLGFLQKEGKKTVFLSNNSEIFVVKLGDRVAGRYELVRLTDDSLTLRSTVTGDETVIPVAESRPPVMR